jgi:hypothetical protein
LSEDAHSDVFFVFLIFLFFLLDGGKKLVVENSVVSVIDEVQA